MSGGDQILSRTGLTEDEDRCVLRGDLFCSIENILEPIALPENMVESMSHVVLVTEINILGLELIFHCFDFSKSGVK